MRFLHTSDWQLGLKRHALEDEARARFDQARFDAVARLLELAVAEECRFVVVAGDVFESNRVDERTVARGLDALATAGAPPVYLLPGNHDPLDAAAVWRSAAFRDHCPPGVHLLASGEPIAVAPGVEVVGAPWRRKSPGADPAAPLEELPPAPAGTLRVAVAHGAVDRLSPDRRDPERIRLAAVEEALAVGRYHYLALGDRHSATEVIPRVWYSGTPEVTRFVEERPGRALVVDLEGRGGSDGASCRVTEHRVGRWAFTERTVELEASQPPVPMVEEALEAPATTLPADKARTWLRLTLTGQVSLAQRAELDRLLERSRQRFAALEVRGRNLLLLPDRLDRDALDLHGFAAAALEDLEAAVRGEAGGVDEEAEGALRLLHRLVVEQRRGEGP